MQATEYTLLFYDFIYCFAVARELVVEIKF